MNIQPNINSNNPANFVKSNLIKKEVFVVSKNTKGLTITYSRSSGKGGQKVNKTESQAELDFDIYSSPASDEVKQQIIEYCLVKKPSQITQDGHIYMYEQGQRNRSQNEVRVIEKLNELIKEALTPEKERIATKATKGSKERRINDKKQQGEKKKQRNFKIDY